MEYKLFIGVDVSKDTLDLVVILEGNELFHQRISNDKKAITAFYRHLLKETSISANNWLVCLEHTGIYCNHLLEFAATKELGVWLENASVIKAFHALERGKSDEMDARRIAEYAYTKREKARIWQAPRGIINEIKSLLALRDRLINSKNRLILPLNEEKRFGNKAQVREHEKLIKPVITNIENQVKKVEQKIEELIDSDKDLKRLYNLMTSVTGVGKVIAVNTIVVTNEFKQINNPKKMACHCGVAPFPYNSGKTIKSKARVSHRANKSMKALFHMAAMAAINSSGELQEYYSRKVEDGKNKMAVLNAVRNKIIHRMFACVRDGRKYEKSYTHALA